MTQKHNNDKGQSGKMRTSTTQTGRFLKLTGMTTSIATKVASNKLKSFFQSQEAAEQSKEALFNSIGEEIASTLSEMKGAVMKVGQIASQMKDILPPQLAEALTVLQKASAPMPFTVIRRQIRKELGDEPEVLFKLFEQEPFAAASIGQVHRATTLDGREVVVKVQYPAVKESIDSDMRHLKRILRLGGLLKVSAEILDLLFAEIKNQLEDELDYLKEADNLREFRQFHASTPWIVIPEVIESLTSEKVLTLSYEPGDDLDSLVDNPAYSQVLRNTIGQRLFDAIGAQIYQLHAVHSDPHPGNFAFRPDGSIIIYDFGAIKRLPEEDIDMVKDLLRAAFNLDYSGVDDALIRLQARKDDGSTISDTFYQEWIELLLPPFDKPPFDFGQSDLHTQLVKKARRIPWALLQAFQPSPKTLMLNRVLSGHYWTLMHLGVNTSFHDNLMTLMDAAQADQVDA